VSLLVHGPGVGHTAVAEVERPVAPPIELGPAHLDAVGVDLPFAQRSSRLARALKRAVDISAAVLGLVLTAPLLLLLAALVRLDSKGPALYRQRRMGRGQRPFTITKFRSMHPDGSVTRIGRILRPLGIDELPQLWNVLTGEMSLVGPRPEVLDRVPFYLREIPGYANRHFVRPGITGWAQVNGLRGRVSIAERLRFDLQYVATWTLWLDLRIVLWTTVAVWRDTRRAWRT
jgi:lipopolysaccharide/colanic/teichoic acid biosynthesis glycosyltransferase